MTYEIITLSPNSDESIGKFEDSYQAAKNVLAGYETVDTAFAVVDGDDRTVPSPAMF